MAIDSILRGLALKTDDAADPGIKPELAFGFTDATGQSWTLGRMTAAEQGSFGGRLVIATNPGGATPADATIERMTISQSGNVGIGTATPGAPLHVAQYMTVGPFAASSGQGGIDVVGPAAEFGFVRRSLTAWPTNPAAGDRFVWYNPDGSARLWTHGRGDLLTVTSLGNVGIGTTAPRTPLHTLGRIATGLDFNSPGAITFFPPDGFAWFHIDNGPAGGRPIGRLRFSYGGNPGDFEVISMLQNGNVGIGTPAPATKLHVTGARIRLQKAGTTQRLDLRADGSALDIESAGADLFLNNNNLPVRIRNLVQGSSRAWKEDIADLPLEAAVGVLQHLNPISFVFKEDASHQQHLGFVAEELPATVATPDRKGFSPMAIIAVLTKVVKRQQQQIMGLQAEMVRIKDMASCTSVVRDTQMS